MQPLRQDGSRVVTKILLATGAGDWPARVERALDHRGAHQLDVSHVGVTEVAEFIRRIADADTQVVVIGPGYERADAIVLARVANRTRPDVSVILIVDSSPDLLQEAVHAGAQDALDPNVSDAILRGSLTLAIEMAGRRRKNWQHER